MQRMVFLLVLSVLLSSGCSVGSPLLRKPSNAPAADPSLSSIDRAKLLHSQGDYTAAAIEFRKIVDCAEDDWQRGQAQIGVAMSLIKLHRLPAALAALGPLPAEPASETDCHKLAIAGEIYLRQHCPREAETCLELALDAFPLETALAQSAAQDPGGAGAAPARASNAVTLASVGPGGSSRPQDQTPEVIPPGVPIAPPPAGTPESWTPHPLIPGDGAVAAWPAWMAGCCANLGCAYLKNDKPEKAAVLYAFAAQQFRIQGDRIAAERAQRVCDDLNAVLRQYAPFKPFPLTERLPPGNK